MAKCARSDTADSLQRLREDTAAYYAKQSSTGATDSNDDNNTRDSVSNLCMTSVAVLEATGPNADDGSIRQDVEKLDSVLSA